MSKQNTLPISKLPLNEKRAALKETWAQRERDIPPLKVSFSMSRADIIMPSILADYRACRGVFAGETSIPPQDKHIPEGIKPGSKKHRIWIFFVLCHMRGAIRSDGAFAGHKRLYALHPELYHPATVAMMKPSEVSRLIVNAKVGLGFASKAIGKIWVHNARVLTHRLKGDPYNLFIGAKKFDTIVKRAIGKHLPLEQKLKGMRHKVLSLFTIFYQGLGLVPMFRDQTTPIDFHHLRIFLATGLMVANRELFRPDPHIMRRARQFSTRMIRRFKSNSSELAHALWILGSEVCHYSPDHTWASPNRAELLSVTTDKRSLDSPIVAEALRRIDDDASYMFAAADRGPARSINDKCLGCPVMTECTKAISSTPYYALGWIFTKEKPAYSERYLWVHRRWRKLIETGSLQTVTSEAPAEFVQQTLDFE